MISTPLGHFERSGGHVACAFGGQIEGLWLVVLHRHDDLLHVEDDVDDILDHALDRAELVLGTLDLQRRDRGTRESERARSDAGCCRGCNRNRARVVRQ